MRQLIKSAVVNVFQQMMFNESVTNMALNGSLARRFVSGSAGEQHGLNANTRRDLLKRFKLINRRVKSATQWPSYLVMAEFLLNMPKSMVGDVIECGCYKGASTAALSLICERIGRRLIVCDSFEGLPPDDAKAKHVYPHLGVTTTYGAGEFAGKLDEVKSNVTNYGHISVCEFVPGFFNNSLKLFNRPLVFGFFDVDLLSSMQDCIRNLWPHFAEGAAIFTDDSCDMEVVKIWFDKPFWNAELSSEPPGYVGSGCGLPSLSPAFSALGYTLKGHGQMKPISFT